jgi:ATP-dependent DNA ligase
MLFRPSPTKKRSGLIAPCIPTLASRPPAGPRLLARKQDGRVRLFTQRGYDWTDRYPPDRRGCSRALEGDGTVVFEHACKLGLEGIVSKHRENPYRSGPSKTWLKIKNPAATSVTRFERDV